MILTSHYSEEGFQEEGDLYSWRVYVRQIDNDWHSEKGKADQNCK